MSAVVSRPLLGTGRCWGVVAIAAMLASAAKAATYTATDLYTLQIPAGTSPTSPDGRHLAVDGQVVGAEEYFSPSLGGATTDALLWTGPADASIDLNPTGYVTSEAVGIGGNQQVGSAAIEVSPNVYQEHGLLWSGSAASAVDLNPVGFTASQAYGSDGVHQVGWGTAQLPFVDVAVLWSGTAASGVELEPPTGFYISEAFSVRGIQQVGFGYSLATNNPMHALLWSGTSASVVDLNPKGFNNSQALGVGGGLQVGYAENVKTTNGPPPPTFAMLWSGTAASAINLNPAGFSSSEAEDVGDGMGSEPATIRRPTKMMLSSGPARLHQLLIWPHCCPQGSSRNLSPTRLTRKAISSALLWTKMATTMRLNGQRSRSPSRRR